MAVYDIGFSEAARALGLAPGKIKYKYVAAKREIHRQYKNRF